MSQPPWWKNFGEYKIWSKKAFLEIFTGIDRNALQAIFVEGAPTGCLTPAEVALAKASWAAAAARSALEAVEHIKIPLPSTLGAAELKA